MFLSDGRNTVRDLQTYLSPESGHILDWFHITLRLTVMGQMVKGMPAELKYDNKHSETATTWRNTWKATSGISGMVTSLHALQRIDDEMNVQRY